jgi:hypothetical protein
MGFGDWIGRGVDKFGRKMDQFGNWITTPARNKREDIDQAAQKQVDSLTEASGYQKTLFDQLQEMNAPMMEMGDEQLGILKEGIESGAFAPDESMFGLYQQYIAPEYEQGGKYQSEPREKLVTPEKFKYAQPTPEGFRYDAPAPAPYVDSTQGRPAPVEYKPFQDNSQAPNFNPVQNFGDRPQQYRSGEAPQAQYVQPQQQYQQQPFELKNDPVYQKRLADAQGATEASAAARGMQLSGATLKALQQNASDLAAQEGDAAFDRYQKQDQTGYSRFQDQRTDLKDTTRYQSEDQYRRYLDSQNIRGAEADKAIAQWNTDRGFTQDANIQNFQTAQGAYSQNRGQNADIYNMNAGNKLAYNAQNQGQYNADRDFSKGVQGQNFDQYGRLREISGKENAQNYEQFDANRGYATSEDQRYTDNSMDVYGINNDNYGADRAFDYGVGKDYDTTRLGITQYNTGNKQQQNANYYNMLNDQYTRSAESKQNKYGMIGDLINYGMNARNSTAGAIGDYFNSMGNISTAKADAAAAAAAAKSNVGLFW